eukprot:scaffold134_cov244-Pinguiococcus_pyrenoidosus.AAC.7
MAGLLSMSSWARADLLSVLLLDPILARLCWRSLAVEGGETVRWGLGFRPNAATCERIRRETSRRSLCHRDLSTDKHLSFEEVLLGSEARHRPLRRDTEARQFSSLSARHRKGTKHAHNPSGAFRKVPHHLGCAKRERERGGEREREKERERGRERERARAADSFWAVLCAANDDETRSGCQQAKSYACFCRDLSTTTPADLV